MLGRIVANLSAMIFVITLNLKFTKEIGLYCSIVSALLFFGIKMMVF